MSGWSSVMVAVSVGAVCVLPLAGCGDKPSAAPAQAHDTSAASHAALQAGQDACRDKTVRRVMSRYLAVAKRTGHARRGSAYRELLRFAGRQAKTAGGGPGLSELTARVYALTLPRAAQRDGFTGCFAQLDKRRSHR